MSDDGDTLRDVSMPAKRLYRELFERHGLGEFSEAPTNRGTFRELIEGGWIDCWKATLAELPSWRGGYDRLTRPMYQCLCELAPPPAGNFETKTDDASSGDPPNPATIATPPPANAPANVPIADCDVYVPADTLWLDHGIRASRLSEAATAGKVETRTAPKGYKDSNGRKVLKLYHEKQAIKHCSARH